MKTGSRLLGAIADDYTGGSDLASMLSERGVRTVQVLGLPGPDFMQSLEDYQAVVISLKSRSLPAAEACALADSALDRLMQIGARQIYFKYCSTFDSTAQGNIGPVIDRLMDRLDTAFTVAVPALPVNGRTQYMGHLFVGTQLLSNSHMRHHPITPMTESNLVRHLQYQTRRRVGLIAHPIVRAGTKAILRQCEQLKADGISIALADTIADEDLIPIAEAVADMPMVTGGSGLASAFPQIWKQRGWLRADPMARTAPGNQRSAGTLILSGSCSEMTLRQIRRYQESGGQRICLDVPRLLQHGPQAEASTLFSRIEHALSTGSTVMVSSSAGPSEREAMQQASGVPVEPVHLQIEEVLARVAVQAVEQGLVQTLIVAGGETSGAVVDHLKISAVEVLDAIAPGVPALRNLGSQPLMLALKSGNFGAPDFFMKAADRLRQIPLEETRAHGA